MEKAQEFRDFVKSRELTIKRVAKLSGIPFTTLYQKVREGDLTLSEVRLIVKALRMTDEEVIEVFIR